MKRIKDGELRNLSEADREERLGKLVAETRAPLNGEVVELSARIARLAGKLGINADTVRDDVATGAVQETEDVCHLLMLLNLRNRLESLTARPG